MKIEKMHNYAEMARQFVLDLPTTFNFGRDVVDRGRRQAGDHRDIIKKGSESGAHRAAP